MVTEPSESAGLAEQAGSNGMGGGGKAAVNPSAAGMRARDVPNGQRSGSQGAGSRVPKFRAIGFWKRLIAGGIDALIIFSTALLLAWVVGKITGFGLPPNLGLDYWLDLLFGNDPSMVTIFVLMIAVTSIYLFVFQAVIGRTVGKRVIGAQVIDVYGDPPTAGRAALRTLGSLVSVATLGLGFLWIGFDSEKRGFHDWIASTYVVADVVADRAFSSKGRLAKTAVRGRA